MKDRYLNKVLSKINGKPKDYDKNLIGVSGFMFIFAVFCFYMTFNSLINIIYHVGYLSSPDIMVYAILMLAVYLPADIGLKIATIYYIFKKHIIFRKLYVINSILVVASMMTAFAYFMITEGLFYDTAIFQSALALLWIVYLYTSRRVKNTFIYPHCDYAKQVREKIMSIAEKGDEKES